MLRIFIGSSDEHRAAAETVATWLEEFGAEVEVWWNTFKPGDYTLPKLLETAHQKDGAVLLFSEDDVTTYRGSTIKTPRDNVVLEYGLFLGNFPADALRRVLPLRMGVARLASDLHGLTYVPIDLPHKALLAKKAVKGWYESLLALPELRNLATGPICKSKSKQQLFEDGTKILRAATSCVTLCAKTPVPFVGPRPYDKIKKYTFEKEQHDIYWDLCEKAGAGKLEMEIISSLPSLKKEIDSFSAHGLASVVKDNLKKIESLLGQPGSKLSVRWYAGASPSTYMVADHQSLLWWKGGSGDNVWINDGSEDLADALRTRQTDAEDRKIGRVLRTLNL